MANTDGIPAASEEAQRIIAAVGSAVESQNSEELDRLLREMFASPSTTSTDILVLCEALTRVGRIPQTIQFLQGYLPGSPTSARAFECLALLFRSVGDLNGAVQCAERALSLNALSPVASAVLGLCNLQKGQPQLALAQFKRAADLAPELAFVRYSMGVALNSMQRFSDAEVELRKAVELAPLELNTQWLLANVLKKQGRTAEAVEVSERAAEASQTADGYCRLAMMLADDRRYAESEPHLRKAIELDPTHVKAHEGLGLRLQHMGRFDEAAAEFTRVIELDPADSHAYLWLVRNRTITEADRPLIDKMIGVISQPARSPEDIRQLSYALGKAFDDLGDYGKAMSHYDEANRRSFQVELHGHSYALGEHKARTDRMISGMTKAFLDQDHGVAQEDSRPVFIVGMMRSGTTLVEQVLSSHPEIAAGGEIFFWTHPGVIEATNALSTHKVDRQALVNLAQGYSRLLDKIDSSKPKITDKMPLNFERLGAIRILFPNAKVIHCRRDPLDTCLSIYTSALSGAGFLFDKKSILFVYKEYLRLMEHWREVLPAGFMMDLDYEALISDREAQARAMVAFCGLDWNDACLRPEDNAREVTTPSVWQVRQPIYDSSVGRWKRYEPFLGDFKELLPR